MSEFKLIEDCNWYEDEQQSDSLLWQEKKEEPLDEDNEDSKCEDWIDKLCLFRDALFFIYFLLIHWDKLIDLLGSLGNLSDTCPDVWTILAFNVFEFVSWVELGDKISSPVSFRRAEE